MFGPGSPGFPIFVMLIISFVLVIASIIIGRIMKKDPLWIVVLASLPFGMTCLLVAIPTRDLFYVGAASAVSIVHITTMVKYSGFAIVDDDETGLFIFRLLFPVALGVVFFLIGLTPLFRGILSFFADILIDVSDKLEYHTRP